MKSELLNSRGIEVDCTYMRRFSKVLTDENAPVLRDPRLLVDEQRGVRVYYAPFEYLNANARVVLVGITPGPTQMVNANNEARRVLLNGGSMAIAAEQAKKIAAFSGEPMRGNLIQQLNHWKVHRWLDLEDSNELFGEASYFVQTTSLLRYPVFVNDEDYRGTPDMTRHPLLRRYLLEYFVQEVSALPDAIFLGLGPKVQTVLDQLVRDRVLDARRVIGGMLHPSGNCTYRIRYLTGQRIDPVPHATNPIPYDKGRSAFGERFLMA